MLEKCKKDRAKAAHKKTGGRARTEDPGGGNIAGPNSGKQSTDGTKRGKERRRGDGRGIVCEDKVRTAETRPIRREGREEIKKMRVQKSREERN